MDICATCKTCKDIKKKIPDADEMKEKAVLAYLKVTNPEAYEAAVKAAELKKAAGGDLIAKVTDLLT